MNIKLLVFNLVLGITLIGFSQYLIYIDSKSFMTYVNLWLGALNFFSAGLVIGTDCNEGGQK